MAARRVQAPLRELTRSLYTPSSSSSSRTAALASSASASSSSASPSTCLSQARTFASAASMSALSSIFASASASSSASSIPGRGSDFRSSPALGTSVTGDSVLSHFSSAPFSSTCSDLLGGNAEIALRALTHESYFNAREGHNRRLAFVGRRTLKLFTTLFLHSRLQTLTKGDAAHNYISRLLESPNGVDSILTTHRLGHRVGKELGLEKIMRWTPAVSDGQLGARETGLFKVRGVAVEAVVGAIYHQKGAAEASKFFQSFILPSLLHDGFPAPVPEQLTKGILSTASNDA
ncbi:hypothetical protein NDA11_000831 [Ustilago hordei]|nr:hypothetical protein NDA10_008055 [Ustilago hordei]KAJ1575442.1 hypothetical protein NDA15_002479 [Ustilago hordei]KAJ1577162.1 hypothetical protein NDA12_001004 [Ustilago hordei]KAJ1595057.1 hypothetical protein NDA11_000831 [Ustilago hordei]KAJ1596951.1 hypothetical protein NDA14_001696 [Ustilago hordei]